MPNYVPGGQGTAAAWGTGGLTGSLYTGPSTAGGHRWVGSCRPSTRATQPCTLHRHHRVWPPGPSSTARESHPDPATQESKKAAYHGPHSCPDCPRPHLEVLVHAVPAHSVLHLVRDVAGERDEPTFGLQETREEGSLGKRHSPTGNATAPPSPGAHGS